MANQAQNGLQTVGDPSASDSERAIAIQKLLTEWIPLLSPVQSPEERFQDVYKEANESHKKAQARFNAVSSSNSGQPEDPSAFNACLDVLLCCGKRLKELVAEHEAHKDEENSKYKQSLWAPQEALVFRLLDLFGPKLGEQLCKKWLERAHLHSNNPTEQDTIATPEGNQAAHQTTNSNCEPATNTAVQPARSPDIRLQNATNETTPIRNTTESSRDQQVRTCYPSPDEARQTSKAQHKRPPTSPQEKGPRPPKRPRSNVPEPNEPLTGDRTIHFDDVFQNGNAATKYIITEHKGYWYILECRKHKLHFRSDNPIKGARKHLTGAAHRNMQPNYDATIRLLGTQVLGCTKELAVRNNEFTNRPSYENVGRPLSVYSASGSASPHGPRTRSSQLHVNIDPQPGEIYTTFWTECKKYFAILVLPWGNFHSFGWELTLKQTGLLGPKVKVPACYKYDPVTETAEWAETYKPGGKHYYNRKYPVMFFDKDNFPWNCGSWWLPVREFCHYDPNTQGIPFKDKVDQFLIAMEEREHFRNGGGLGSDAGLDEASSVHDNTPHQQTSAVSQPLEAPPEGASLGRVIVIHDSDSEDEDGPSWTYDDGDEMEENTRVKVEQTNEEPQTHTSEAVTAPTQTNPTGSNETEPQPNGIGHRLDSSLGLQANSMPDPTVPIPPTIDQTEHSNNPFFGMAGRTFGQRQEDFPPSFFRPRERQLTPTGDITNQAIPTGAPSNTRAPEAVMTAPEHNQSSTVTPAFNDTSVPPPRMNEHPQHSTATSSSGLYTFFDRTTNTATNAPSAAENNGLRWTSPMTPHRGPMQSATFPRPEVALEREIDIRNAAVRRGNWRQPFISEDTE
ncbi:hypothetical protein IL306_000440 [Fusarium sp. DS 682]|nr:hypothetical protein IL306_000440 [Fusarium sp. DS 682]